MNNIVHPEINQPADNKTSRSDSFLRTVALDGPALVAIVQARDLKVTFVNNTFEYYLGYSNKDLETTGVLFSDFIDDYLKDRLMHQLGNIAEDIASRSRFVVYELTGRNGAKSPYYLYAAPMSKDGTDITEDSYHFVLHPDFSQWDMPFGSFNSRELFLQQFNSEDFGTFEWIIDVDKVFWSAGVYRIYEVERQKHIDNLYAREFVHPDDAEKLGSIMKEAMLAGEDVDVEYKIITAKNKVKTIHSLGRMIKNKAGAPIKFVGSIRDISNQRLIEEDLKNKVLELHRSNQELEEFAYVASHDMQEPLRKITTFSDRLSEKYRHLLGADGAMYLSRMIASAENMRSLINDLLDFSRITKTEQPFEPVLLNVVLRMVKTELELVIEETGTVIDSTPLPVIQAISSQMKQLFVNIISNAIKFHKQDVSPVIRIEATKLSEAEINSYELLPDTIYHKIQITDNGIGFEEEYALRIFQVFQRLHGKSEYPGSGIGLAICKKILEYHNGMIYAENIPGFGARFTFILPETQPVKETAI
jgi:signal transduction histidine kinase